MKTVTRGFLGVCVWAAFVAVGSQSGAAELQAFDLQSPRHESVIHDYAPVLKWKAAAKDGLDHYEVWINGKKAAETKTNSYSAMNTIRNGETSWHVVAVGTDGKKVKSTKPFTFKKTSILTTRWGEQVTAQNVHPEYPRPQLVRPRWLSLNGEWDYALKPLAQTEAPTEFDGKILVPFPLEAGLSGVMVTLGYEHNIWYSRGFEVPKEWKKDRVLLNFEAVDYQSTVWVNGKKVGEHEGGYDPFSFDVTDALKKKGEQRLVVKVVDPTRSGTQPFGKQVSREWAIKIHSLFTATSGIWLPVWLEPVPETHIKALRMVPDIDKETLTVTPLVSGEAGTVELLAKAGGKVVAKGSGKVGETITLSIKEPRLWSPVTPFLYDLTATLKGSGKDDVVESYFGMRKIALGKVGDKSKIFLNNDLLFMQEPLDQGYWPDGNLTHPTDEALRWDIELTKYLGYNATRKHIKVEPRRWYYWADKLGLLVQQDAVSPGRDEFGKDKSKRPAQQFESDLKAMIDNLYSSPSIYAWVIFNESWGQHDTERYTDLVEGWDPSRLTQQASGWNDKGGGDIVDTHDYGPNPKGPKKLGPDRASMIGEYGARGLNVEGHRTWPSKMWSGMVDNYSKMTENYLHMLGAAAEQKKNNHISGAVYSVLTDEEGENCGLVTYDREVFKVDPDKVIQASRDLWFIPSTFTYSSIEAPKKVAPGEVFHVTVMAENKAGKTAMGVVEVFAGDEKIAADDSWVPTGGRQVIDVPVSLSQIGTHQIRVGKQVTKVTVTDSAGVIDFAGWEGEKSAYVVERVGILRVAYPYPETGIAVKEAPFEGTWTSPVVELGKSVSLSRLVTYTRIVEGEEVVAVVSAGGKSKSMTLKNGRNEVLLGLNGASVQVTLTLKTDNQKMHVPEIIALGVTLAD